MKQIVAWALLTIIYPWSLQAADWPNWRGPGWNGISTERIATWGSEGPKVLWSKEFGQGFSAVSVCQGKVYTLGNPDGKTDKIYCFRESDGQEVWCKSYPCPAKGFGGPRVTPTIDGPRLYSLSREGDLFCLNKDTGAEIWARNLSADFGLQVPFHGFTGSPRIIGEMLYLNAGTCGLALRKLSGVPLWCNGSEPSGNATPVPYTLDGQDCLAIFTAKGMAGVNRATGARLWFYPWECAANAPDPFFLEGRLFMSTGWKLGSALLDLRKKEPNVLWKNPGISPHFMSPILWRGFVYGFEGDVRSKLKASFRCINLETGKTAWETPMNGSAILVDQKLLIVTENGELVLAEANPEKYVELCRGAIGAGEWWTAPVYANGRIYCRTTRGKLLCLEGR